MSSLAFRLMTNLKPFFSNPPPWEKPPYVTGPNPTALGRAGQMLDPGQHAGLGSPRGAKGREVGLCGDILSWVRTELIQSYCSPINIYFFFFFFLLSVVKHHRLCTDLTPWVKWRWPLEYGNPIFLLEATGAFTEGMLAGSDPHQRKGRE